TWFYRIRPSVLHGRFRALDAHLVRSAPLPEETPPEQLRWDPLPIGESGGDFVDGLVTMAANGSVGDQHGMAVHVYRAARSMSERFLYDADGELLIVPQLGRLVVHTECGVLAAAPGEIAVVPRGMKFRIVLPDGPSRG